MRHYQHLRLQSLDCRFATRKSVLYSFVRVFEDSVRGGLTRPNQILEKFPFLRKFDQFFPTILLMGLGLSDYARKLEEQ